jgi:hypothetical protein
MLIYTISVTNTIKYHHLPYPAVLLHYYLMMDNNIKHDRIEWQIQQEEMSDYVAHLQIHMALQARNLVPAMTDTPDSRQSILQQTQTMFETLASRQMG